jgi:hypothetical protein
MIPTAESTSPYGLGTAQREAKYVAVDVKFVARPKVRWYERQFLLMVLEYRDNDHHGCNWILG